MNLLFVIPVVFIIILSALIVKIAAVALNLTGLDNKRSFFQALSAFTGTGFTTRDSELIVANDIRRRIIMMLMVLGNAGLISVISTLMLSFMKGGMDLTPIIINIGVILLVILILVMVSRNEGLTRRITKKIQQKLVVSPTFTKRPVEEIMRLAEGYGIAEVTLKEDCEDVGKTLYDSSFRQKDILVIAIERGASVMPTPRASDELLINDTLICYGKMENIKQIGKGSRAE
jgi:hypothetical protein